MVNYIEKHINSHRGVLGAFLDIQASFDIICPKHIKASLLKHRAGPDLAEWYYTYITHRHRLDKDINRLILLPEASC